MTEHHTPMKLKSLPDPALKSLFWEDLKGTNMKEVSDQNAKHEWDSSHLWGDTGHVTLSGWPLYKKETGDAFKATGKAAVSRGYNAFYKRLNPDLYWSNCDIDAPFLCSLFCFKKSKKHQPVQTLYSKTQSPPAFSGA